MGCRALLGGRPHGAVVNPKQQSSEQADANNGVPGPLRLMRDFGELMHHPPAKPSADERSDADRQEGKTHVRPLLSGRRKPRNVFVIARLLDDLSERKDEEGEYRT